MENNDKELKTKSGNKVKVGLIVALIALCIISVAILCHKFAGEGKNNGQLRVCLTTNGTKSITVSYLEKGDVSETVSKDVPSLEIQGENPKKAKKGGKIEYKSNTDPLNEGISVKITYPQNSSDDNKAYTITYYQDGNQLWETDISEYWVKDVNFAKDGVYAIGETYPASGKDEYVYFTKLDSNGRILFSHKINHNLENENIVKVVDNGDGTCTAFSYENAGKVICAATFDSNGNMVSDHKIETDKFIALHDVIGIGDGYLLRMGEIGLDRGEAFYKLDKEYNICNGLIFSSDGNLFQIRDMIEYEGRLYLSTYEVRVKANTGKQYEIDNLVSHIVQILDNGGSSDKSLAELLRDEYTAVLLVCDEQTCEPIKCCTVPGAMGAYLSVNKDNMLVWDTETVVFAEFASPTVNSRTIGGSCRIYSYFFDANDSLLGSEQGGITLYMR